MWSTSVCERTAKAGAAIPCPSCPVHLQVAFARLGVSEPWHVVTTWSHSSLFACSWDLTDFFWGALFCINPHHCSTSSDVTNTHGFSLLFPEEGGGRLVWAAQYFCFGLVILETNLKTYVHFSSFMWLRQGRRDRPGKRSWNLPQSSGILLHGIYCRLVFKFTIACPIIVFLKVPFRNLFILSPSPLFTFFICCSLQDNFIFGNSLCSAEIIVYTAERDLYKKW